MSNEPLDYINRDIVNVKNEIQVLNKLVRDGNGQPSLIQQVTTLNNRIDNVEMDLQAGFEDLKHTLEESHRTALEKQKLSWHFKTAIIVALITSITSIYITYYQQTATQQNNNVGDAAIAQELIRIHKRLDEMTVQSNTDINKTAPASKK